MVYPTQPVHKVLLLQALQFKRVSLHKKQLKPKVYVEGSLAQEDKHYFN